jgi:hypothetical protein
MHFKQVSRGERMQEFEVAFYVRKQLWSFSPLDAVVREMDETWPAAPVQELDGWSEHRYVISQQGGDEVALSFILRRRDALAEQDSARILQQLEDLVRKYFPSGTRLWRATQTLS